MGSDRPFVIASGTAALTPGVPGTEKDAPDPRSAAAPRIPSEKAALSLAERDVRSSAVRLSPPVHGEGDHGFVATLIDIARDKGVSGYIGDGTNRWPAVHRLDAAHLFRLALEKAPAGSPLHAVADEACRSATSPRSSASVSTSRRSPSLPKDAGEHFGSLAGFLAADVPASSALTRERVGWQPTHPGLIDDLDQGHYFHAHAAPVGAHNPSA